MKYPILEDKYYGEESVFNPENLLREARRQKGLKNCPVPNVCILDPDGDVVAYLKATKQANLNSCWACYHSQLYSFEWEGMELGIIGSAVGASYAVLLAEQLFISGCQLLISVTSAGVINPPAKYSRFILIESAIRDEGTSYHYLPPAEKSFIDPVLAEILSQSFQRTSLSVELGSSWTTDAPFRETASAIRQAKIKGVHAVEMEAAALYAFAEAKQKKVVCYAHLTNSMAQHGDDFEKGAENGSLDSLAIIFHTAKNLLTHTHIN